MSPFLQSILSLDIRSAVRTAIEQGDDYQFEKYGPTDCETIPTGAEAAFFPAAGIALVATNGPAYYYDLPRDFELSLEAVLDLLNYPDAHY